MSGSLIQTEIKIVKISPLMPSLFNPSYYQVSLGNKSYLVPRWLPFAGFLSKAMARFATRCRLKSVVWESQDKGQALVPVELFYAQ